MENGAEGSLINQEAGIEICGDNREIYLQILTLMLDYEGGEKGQMLTDSYKNQDWALFANEVHALKSSAAGIGASALSGAAKKMEAAVDGEDFNYVANHQEAFFKLLQDTISEIHTILET